ncbi:MAG TPA: thioesterase family protein [Spongiibacteraceae bacterium]|nr:thioesterase family protein [Spongiibacteraceae bacterium]
MNNNGELNGSREFLWPVRVYIEDTDAGGIVFYVNYLKYMERARTEFMRALGYGKNSFEPSERDENAAGEGGIFTDQLMFVVHSVAASYHKPARLDDELFATARILSLGAAQMRFEQRILRGSEPHSESLSYEVLCSGEVKIACVDRRTLKPRRIPNALLAALSV